MSSLTRFRSTGKLSTLKGAYFQIDGSLSCPFAWIHRQGAALCLHSSIPLTSQGSDEKAVLRNVSQTAQQNNQSDEEWYQLHLWVRNKWGPRNFSCLLDKLVWSAWSAINILSYYATEFCEDNKLSCIGDTHPRRQNPPTCQQFQSLNLLPPWFCSRIN